MPRLDDSGEALLQAGQDAKARTKRAWDSFSDFAIRDNVLEVAVGLIIAASFTTVVSSFVSDIILPPISLLPFLNKNLGEKFAVLRQGPQHANGHRYNTLKQALDDGAVVMAYGSFLDKTLNLLGVGLVLYFIANVYAWVSKDSIIHHTVKCKYCRKSISDKAQRCVNCTSWQDGREN
ncbi:MAG: ion [Lasallia pustulata]|uniref:Ion n=1 Tax=Lasallia pustulata TaxID=136370 RepID=A0A5M8PVS9_9LECA|nr:MAG: ion [Lasallia pustulata]